MTPDPQEMMQMAGKLMKAAHAIQSAGKTPKKPMGDILMEYCAGQSIEALRGPGRSRVLFIPRAKAMLAMRKEGYSYPQIGRYFGGRDHTSVMYACKRAVTWETLSNAV